LTGWNGGDWNWKDAAKMAKAFCGVRGGRRKKVMTRINTPARGGWGKRGRCAKKTPSGPVGKGKLNGH